MQFLQPEGWPRPPGYAHGVAASGRMVFVSGTIGWDQHGLFAGPDLCSQVRQALCNIVTVLKAGDALPQHIVRMTWYILDRQEYFAATKEIGVIYRELIGAHYPAMSVVQVAALLEPAARVEIEVTALVPQAE